MYKEKEKMEALKDFLRNEKEYGKEELDMVQFSDDEDSTFSCGGEEYRVLTEYEADEAARAYIDDSLWAFNADFILEHSKVSRYDEQTFNRTVKALERMQELLCEDANAIVEALIEDLGDFEDEAIDSDGRGHFLAMYDGEENETEDGEFFIYRTN